MQQKRFSIVLIVVMIIMVFAIGMGSYSFIKKSGTSKNIITTETQKEMSTDTIYQDSQRGFTLNYPSTLRPFPETFVVDETEHWYYCRYLDKPHGIYDEVAGFRAEPLIIDPEIASDIQCSVVNLSFENYTEKYFARLKGGLTVRNAKLWKITNSHDLEAYGIFWETPLRGSTPDSPPTGQSLLFYYVLIDPLKNIKLAGRALRFFLDQSMINSAGNLSSYPNGYCEPNENPIDYPIDCKENWDSIITKIFSSFKFTQ